MKLEIKIDLWSEKAFVHCDDNDYNTIWIVDVLNQSIRNAWKECGKGVEYSEFCEIAKLARYHYKRERKDQLDRNAKSYALYWSGYRGKSYSHYKREYLRK